MNYRELQAAIKQFRIEGLTDKNFKLNQKKTVLMSEYERVTKIDIRPDKSTDEDQITCLTRKIAELEAENKALKSENEALKDENEKLKTKSTDNESDDNPNWEDQHKIDEAREKFIRGVTVDGHIKGSILDILSSNNPVRVNKERQQLEQTFELIDGEREQLENTLSYETDIIAQEIEYEIIECEFGEVIEVDIVDIDSDDEDDF